MTFSPSSCCLWGIFKKTPRAQSLASSSTLRKASQLDDLVLRRLVVALAFSVCNVTCAPVPVCEYNVLSDIVVDMEKKKALPSDMVACHTCDMLSRCPADNSSITGGDMLTSCSGPASSLCQCSEAATALLEHYHGSTEFQLIEFITTNFPSIPANHRHVLTRAALAGALFASRLHFVVERNRMSLNREKKLMAIDAGSSLSLLNAGLRTEPLQPREMVSPAAVISEEEDALFVGESPTPPPATVGSIDRQLPLSLESCSRNFDIAEAGIIQQPVDGMHQQHFAPIQPAGHSAAADGGANRHVQAVRPYVTTGTTSPSANPTYEPIPIADLKRAKAVQQPPAESAAEPKHTSTRIPMAAPSATQRSSYSSQQSVPAPRRHLLRSGAAATPQKTTRVPPTT